MALYTIKEVAELIGVEQKTIHALCSPSKRCLIKNADNMIDTAFMHNKTYIERRLAQNAAKSNPQPVQQVEEIPKPRFAPPEKKTYHKKKVPSHANNGDLEILNQFQAEKDRLTLEKMKADVRKKELEIEKLEGDFISMDEATKIISSWADARDKELMVMLEKEINYICTKEEISSASTSKYIAKIVSVINRCNEEATKKLIFSYEQSQDREDSETTE